MNKSRALLTAVLEDEARTVEQKLIMATVYALNYVEMKKLQEIMTCRDNKDLWLTENGREALSKEDRVKALTSLLIKDGYLDKGVMDENLLFPKFLTEKKLLSNTTNTTSKTSTINDKNNNKEKETTICENNSQIITGESIYAQDQRVLLKAIEEGLLKQGKTMKISKNAKKLFPKITGFLNTNYVKTPHKLYTKDRGSFYSAYVDFAISYMKEMFSIKSLTYSKIQKAFLKKLEENKADNFVFSPTFHNCACGNGLFYGIKMNTIPKNIKESNYWPTLYFFLLKRIKDGSPYPICSQVLVALERIIIYKFFLKETDTKELIELHVKYKKEYKKAHSMNKLDNLAEFFAKEKNTENE